MARRSGKNPPVLDVREMPARRGCGGDLSLFHQLVGFYTATAPLSSMGHYSNTVEMNRIPTNISSGEMIQVTIWFKRGVQKRCTPSAVSVIRMNA